MILLNNIENFIGQYSSLEIQEAEKLKPILLPIPYLNTLLIKSLLNSYRSFQDDFYFKSLILSCHLFIDQRDEFKLKSKIMSAIELEDVSFLNHYTKIIDILFKYEMYEFSIDLINFLLNNKNIMYY